MNPKEKFDKLDGQKIEGPNSRMQNDQIETPADDVEKKVKVEDSSFSKKTVKAKGSQLKQEVAASVLNNGSDFAGSPYSSNASASVSTASRAGLRSMSYSGDAGTILGSAASTPAVGSKDRADTRFGKKIDDVNKRINYLASEQILVEYDAPKPLSEAGDQVQGYNGTPKNLNARSQKTTGKTPSELLFDRSVDEISRDEIFYSMGQVVKTKGVEMMDCPTKTESVNSDGEIVVSDFTTDRGNYMPRDLEVTITKSNNGVYVSKFAVVDFDCNPNTGSAAVDREVADLAATNAIVDMNTAEIARQNIDAKAGRETMPNWSPLGRAVLQPTQTVQYLRDMEAEIGAEIYTARRFARKSLAYQLNKAAKDGQRLTGPLAEMFLKHLAYSYKSNDFERGEEFGNPFSAAAYKAGSASLLIELYDSVGKYNTKADVLTQPRSLKMHLTTAENNINMFKVKPEFVKALNARDCFSTIDHEYDPMAPVFITDGVKLIHAHPWSAEFGYTATSSSLSDRTWTSQLFAYSYSDRMSNYMIKVTNPLLAGISYFFEQNAIKLYKMLHGSNTNGSETIKIPMRHTTRSFSLWSFLILAALPYIIYERTNAFKDVLDFEMNFGYPFADLVSLESVNDVAPANYSLTDLLHPLVVGRMKPETAVTWILPELHWSAGVDTAGLNQNMIVYPWYFSEANYKFTAARTGSFDGDKAAMSIPVIRSGVRLAGLDTVYGFEERSLRLALDKLIVTNYDFDVATGSLRDAHSMFVYKYSQASEGHPGSLDASGTIPGQIEFISLPREIGYALVAPAGIVTPCYCNTDLSGFAFDTLSDYGVTGDDSAAVANLRGDLNSSYKVTCWSSAFATESTAILGGESVTVARGQSFSQKWIEYECYDKDGRHALVRDSNGLVFSYADYINDSIASLKPFTDGYAVRSQQGNARKQTPLTANTVPALRSIHAGLWTRVQKLPFVINPFDCCDLTDPVDVYDLSYLFNCAGFMASDYNEDIHNRVNEIQNKGWMFTSDPFVEASYLNK